MFQNSVTAGSLSNLSHSYNNYTSVRTNFKSRSTKTYTKGCNISDGFFQGQVLQRTFLNFEERRHHTPCGRLEYIKYVRGKQSFSDGEFVFRSGNFMTKLDLQDAYLTVEIDALLQKFLWFIWFIWKGKVYKFQALQIGLWNVAPRVFTKLLKPVAAFLRTRGVRLVLYLDDMLIIGSKVSGNSVVHSAIDFLTALGFNIHKEK